MQSTDAPMLGAVQSAADGVSLTVCPQLQAAEHFSLLATRSMAQSEVLSRITTFLIVDGLPA